MSCGSSSESVNPNVNILEMPQFYLIQLKNFTDCLFKGAVATTAIEGNTLTEKEVKDYLEGNLRVPQSSREYQVREVDNIIKACNDILDVIKSGSTPHLDVESIKTLNRTHTGWINCR